MIGKKIKQGKEIKYFTKTSCSLHQNNALTSNLQELNDCIQKTWVRNSKKSLLEQLK